MSDLIQLQPDRAGGASWDWPDGSLAVWPSATREGDWLAAPQGGLWTEKFYGSREEAARSVGGTIEGGGATMRDPDRTDFKTPLGMTRKGEDPREMCEQELFEEVERLRAERDRLERERHRWAVALQSLTPGGSEYQSPESCVAYVRDLRDRRMRRAKSLASENAGLRGALEGLRRGAIVLSDDCMERDVGNRPDSYTVHAWSAGEWRRVKTAAAAADSALASPSPLTSAVQRVLEAVERIAEAVDALEDAKESRPDLVGLADARVRERVSTAYAAHDHLQALLEGREAALALYREDTAPALSEESRRQLARHRRARGSGPRGEDVRGENREEGHE